MYKYLHTYIHTYIHTFIHTNIHTYTYIHTYIYSTYIYIHTYIHCCIQKDYQYIYIRDLFSLGGVEGAVIHNHGKVEYIDTITNLPKYIILASDGLWDVFDIKEVIFAIDSCLENVQKIINKNYHNNNNIDSNSLNNHSMSLLSSLTVTENDNDKNYNQINTESSESINVNNKNKCNDKNDNATVININNYNNAIKQMLPNKVLEDLIRKNLIHSNINLLDPILNRVAYELVQAAIKSPRWIDIGKKNTYML
jgi:hypothetical protein